MKKESKANKFISGLSKPKKIIGGIVIFFLAIIMFASCGNSDAIKEELEIESSEPKVVETEVADDLFINELFTRTLQIEIANEELGTSLIELGQDVTLFDNTEFIQGINENMDEITTLVNKELLAPGDKDGEESAALYYLDYKEHEMNFINALRIGINEQDLDAMAASFEHQTEAMTYLETYTSALEIAMENKADK